MIYTDYVHKAGIIATCNLECAFATGGAGICTPLLLIFKNVKKDPDKASLGSLPILIASENGNDLQPSLG